MKGGYREGEKLNEFLSFIREPGIMITEKKKREMEIPIIEKEELKEIESKKELIKIAQKY